MQEIFFIHFAPKENGKNFAAHTTTNEERLTISTVVRRSCCEVCGSICGQFFVHLEGAKYAQVDKNEMER